MENCKVCSVCKIKKPISNFQDNGDFEYCRECNKIRSLKYYHANKEVLNRKVLCEICNKEMSRPNYYNHIKTKEHNKNVSKLNITSEIRFKELPISNLRLRNLYTSCCMNDSFQDNGFCEKMSLTPI